MVIDDDTIREAAAGDQEAFAQIYRQAAKYVYHVAWRIVKTHTDAEEVTQEVFITMYRKLNTFAFRSAFKTWIYRMTINTALNYVKKNSRPSEQAVYDEQKHAVSSLHDMQKSVDKEHNDLLIDQLLKMLPEDQRICIVLRNIEGMSYQEMADTLEININTVRSRLSRARESLLKVKNEVMGNVL